MQAEAERKKRATILDSEGAQQSQINVADGERQAAILAAQGEAQAILVKAQATAKSIEALSKAILRTGGREAVSLRIAEQYVNAFGNLAKKGTTLLLPSNPSDPSSMVAQAMAIYGNVMKQTPTSNNNDTNDTNDNDIEQSDIPNSTDNTNSLLGFNPQTGQFDSNFTIKPTTSTTAISSTSTNPSIMANKSANNNTNNVNREGSYDRLDSDFRAPR